uniref:Uncharacterized protein n=1 Tax=Populus trichocarpa TaxID=3694 RepID=A0A3N7FY30_POPTR
MNPPHKTETDLFHNHHDLVPPLPPPPHQIIIPTPQTQSQPSIQDDLSLPEIVLFCSPSSPDNSPSQSSSDNDDSLSHHQNNLHHNSNRILNPHAPAFINPEPHISTQFYTFNAESHTLMIRCILEQRLATPDEIRAATPCTVLKSWRNVWKDRNEDTAYLTGWKRIQEKLMAHVDSTSEVFQSSVLH